ncbi:MarR family winged helix-turn-helix transcriptional regulator [Raoultibacter timonensis]|uniref:HTH marR-type domain-containing protein n=1 Tax=Raoultibacter timonensis TaxID=1907662 RepID=A0ABN6MF91_9ACTN|nr:MarR family transcriptional regulator [Raoultibacter timonensis]BDE95457.1 hypothetical protein CE91St30_07900 [Raoultibacter timonensis]BDF50061.1 hypothetical protein CE91St31_07910 [Raoultibacter timonensis]
MTASTKQPVFPLEGTIWDFLDASKDLFAAERWQSVLMDCSKNELLALVHVYRAGETTMSGIADYVGVPLNTATGIANRLERRGLVERWRSEQDKRVVSVRITEQGRRQVADVMENVGELVGVLFGDLTDEEQRVFLKVVGRIPELLSREANAAKTAGAGRRGVKRIAIE